MPHRDAAVNPPPQKSFRLAGDHTPIAAGAAGDGAVSQKGLVGHMSDLHATSDVPGGDRTAPLEDELGAEVGIAIDREALRALRRGVRFRDSRPYDARCSYVAAARHERAVRRALSPPGSAPPWARTAAPDTVPESRRGRRRSALRSIAR